MNMSKYVLVLTATGSVCDADENQECVVGVTEVDNREQAREVAPILRQDGYTVHFAVVRPLREYLNADDRD